MIVSCNARPALRRLSRGFTLLEIMVVVVILGILAALVAPQVISKVDEANAVKAKQDIRAFETALNLFRLDNFKYPTTDQGLQALAVQPTDSSIRNWKKAVTSTAFAKTLGVTTINMCIPAHTARSSTCSRWGRMAARAVKGSMPTLATGCRTDRSPSPNRRG